MRTFYVTFVLFAVSVVPSLAAPIGDIQERALPALVPKILSVGGSIVGGLLSKNKDNKRFVCRDEFGISCHPVGPVQMPSPLFSALGAQEDKRSFDTIPLLPGETDPYFPDDVDYTKRDDNVACHLVTGSCPALASKGFTCDRNTGDCLVYTFSPYGLPEKAFLKRFNPYGIVSAGRKGPNFHSRSINGGALVLQRCSATA